MAGTISAILIAFFLAGPQLKLPSGSRMPDPYPGQAGDLELARRFAPVFHQRLTPTPENHRFDYITNFDFDGDWIGNNNWEHAADPRFPLKAYIYYSVVETESHYFITYAVFHPRDWSLIQPLIGSIMDQVQQSEKLGKYLPPGVRAQVEINHENDLEGAQVIVAKAQRGAPGLRVVAVETLAHNQFHRYPLEQLILDGERPELYVESQKHGIHNYPYFPGHGLGSLFDSPDGPIRVYRYQGAAEDPEKVQGDVGYDLAPLYSTFWKQARDLSAPNQTFGEVTNLGDIFCQALGALAKRAGPLCQLPHLGTALRGDVAGKNRARLPWGWSSSDEPELSNGAWFLDPARILKSHFPEEERGADQYVSHPFLGVFRPSPGG